MDGEQDIIPLKILCSVLRDAFLILPDRKRDEIRSLMETALVPAYAAFSDLGENAELVQKTVRSAIVSVLVTAGNQTVEHRYLELYRRLKAGETVSGDDVVPAWAVGARRDPAGAFEAMKDAITRAEDEQTKVTIAGVLGAFSDTHTLERSLDFAAAGVAAQNRHFMFDAIGANPEAYPFFRAWVVDHLDYFEDFHMYLYERSFCGTLPYAFAEAEESVAAFAERLFSGKRAETRETVTMIRELLGVNSRFADREA